MSPAIVLPAVALADGASPVTSADTLLAIDFDNVYAPLLREPYGLTRREARETAFRVIDSFRDHLAEAGHRVVGARAFADWSFLGEAQRPLSLAGISPVYVPAQRDKSSADIALSLDVLSTVLTDRRVRHVAIVGGDRDYLPIAMRLREAGRALTVAALASCIGKDIRAFIRGWSDAAMVELDQWIGRSEHGGEDSGVFRKPQETELEVAGSATSGDGVELQELTWTAQHVALVDMMQAFMNERGVTEIYLGPFHRYLRDQSRLGERLDRQMRNLLGNLEAMGIVRVEERLGRKGTFAVAHLCAERVPVGV